MIRETLDQVGEQERVVVVVKMVMSLWAAIVETAIDESSLGMSVEAVARIHSYCCCCCCC